MDITPLVPAGRQIIESYGSGRFRIAGQVHMGSVLVFPDRTESWNAGSAGEATVESLSSVVAAGKAGEIELLLLGCGLRLVQAAAPLRAVLRDIGVGLEPMDTGAACRTFNVLLAEGRRVAAALVAIDAADKSGRT